MRTGVALVAVSLLMLVLVIGCGSSGTQSATNKPQPTPSPQPSPTPSPSPSPGPSPSPTPPPATAGPEFLYTNAFPSGNVYGYQIDAASGQLTLVSGSPVMVQPGTGGSANCTVGCDRMLLADPLGRFLFYDYSDTSSIQTVISLALNPANGALTQADVHRTIGADINVDPQGRFLYVRSDGSGQNQIAGIMVNPGNGTLTDTPGSPYPFAGSLSYMPPAVGASLLYALTFCTATPCGPVINAWSINQGSGALTALPSSTASGSGQGLTGQVLTPSGQYLYVEQQYMDSSGTVRYEIVGYRVGANGAVTPLPSAPQQTGDNGVAQLLMSPNGNFLVHVANSAMRVYTIDPGSGALSLHGTYGPAGLVAIDPAVKYLYTAVGNSIQGYSVDPSNGSLTSLSFVMPSTTVPETPATLAIVRAP